MSLDQPKTIAEMAEYLRSCGSETGDAIAATLEAQATAIELAYGLLWLAPTDRSTKCGELAYQARQVLLTQLGADGKIQGLGAAQWHLMDAESRKNSRSDLHDPDMYLNPRKYFGGE